jgi:hypothetical protein
MDPTQCSSTIRWAFISNADWAVGTETWLTFWGHLQQCAKMCSPTPRIY